MVWGKCKKGGPVGGQSGCEPSFELIVKMHKKVGRVGPPVGGGQGGCEPLIEVIVKMKTRKSGGGKGGSVRRIKVSMKMEKKVGRWGGGAGGSGWM